jgi:hypothetical protein
MPENEELETNKKDNITTQELSENSSDAIETATNDENKSEDSSGQTELEKNTSAEDSSELDGLETDSDSSVELEPEIDEIDPDTIPLQKTENKLKKILIVLAIAIVAVTLILSLLYFSIDTESEEKIANKPQDDNITKPKVYKFNPDEIDSKRLNRKLKLLTKHELIDPNEYNKEKSKEIIIKNDIIENTVDTKLTITEEAKDINSKEEIEISAEQKDTPELDTIAENINNTKESASTKEAIETTTQEELKSIDNQNNKIDKEIANTLVETHEIDNSFVEDVTEQDIEEFSNKDAMELHPIIKKLKAAKKETLQGYTPFIKVIEIRTGKKILDEEYLAVIERYTKEYKICYSLDGSSEVVVGPFANSRDRNSIAAKIKNSFSNVYTMDLTQEELSRRCTNE